MTPAALELEGVHYSYPDGRAALRGVDLRIEVGERVAVLGPNGAGKTTLVLHLNGILGGDGRSGSGRVVVGGLEVDRSALAEIRRRVGVVFQDPDDQLFMPTVARDVGFGPANLGLRGAELDTRVREALEAVDMAEHGERVPHHLSYGQRRRVALATVLAMHPEVLVLDEPSANLDPLARREFAELVRRLELTTVLVTHDLPYALEICSRSVVINEGRIVADGPTASLLADAGMLRANRLELPFGFDVRGY